MKYVYGTVLFALGIAVGVSAQYGAGTPAFAQTKPLPDVTTGLWQTADTLGSIGLAFGFDDVVWASEDAKQAALTLTAEDVEALTDARVAIAKLGHSAQTLSEIIKSDLGNRNAAIDGATNSAGLPSAPYSGICGDERISTGASIAALEVFLAAEIVREESLRGCQETVVLAGEGGNASLACIATDAVYFTAKAVYENLVLCEGDKDSAEIKGTYDRTGHIHSDIEGLDAKLDHIIELILANAEAIEKNRVAICDNKRLITTPSGQRESDCATCSDQPGFPYDWPQGQGNVEANNPNVPVSTPRPRGWLSRLFPRWF